MSAPAIAIRVNPDVGAGGHEAAASAGMPQLDFATFGNQIFWLLVVLGSYGTPEPLTMLALTGHTARAVLRRRLLLGLGYAGLTAAPFAWVLGCAAGVGAGLAVGLAWLGLVALGILTKYAFYPNGLQIRISQALLIAITFTLPGHPAYLPLLLVAAGGLWWQSQRRLRQVLGGVRPETVRPET